MKGSEKMTKKLKARLWLKNLRERRGWTFEETAQRLGLASKAAYFGVETYGKPKILNIELVIKMSEVFNVSIDWIADEERKWREKQNISDKD